MVNKLSLAMCDFVLSSDVAWMNFGRDIGGRESACRYALPYFNAVLR
jgi:hypothetical protein